MHPSTDSAKTDLKEVSQLLLFADFILVSNRKILGLIFLVDFKLGENREKAFVSLLVDVHEMA